MREKPLVLVVDDEDSFCEIMTVQLQAGGFEVATAKNQKEALEKSEALQPDLILMDIHLGGGETGTDVALAIKQNPRTANTRIAFLTSLKEPWPGVVGDNAKVAQEIGMEDFLTKTDDPADNVKKIREILARSPVVPKE